MNLLHAKVSYADPPPQDNLHFLFGGGDYHILKNFQFSRNDFFLGVAAVRIIMKSSQIETRIKSPFSFDNIGPEYDGEMINLFPMMILKQTLTMISKSV